jgi:surface antigen
MSRRHEIQPFVFAILAALTLAACNSAASPPPNAAATAAPTPATPAPPPPAGVVGSLVGQSLDEGDREKAILAQNDAVNSGSRKTWRGAHGAYGYIVPGPEAGNCRDYTHRIFVNGRPQEAKGQACRGSDGAWRVAS